MTGSDTTDTADDDAIREMDGKSARTDSKTVIRGGKATSIGQQISRLTKQAFGKRGFSDGAIITEWPSVIGEQLAELSEPERITYPQGKRAGGTLHLRIASGSIAVELQHLEPLLIERINSHFGYKAVEKIRLIQAPLSKPVRKDADDDRQPLDENKRKQINQILGDVDDPEMHAALERLAQAVLSRRPD